MKIQFENKITLGNILQIFTIAGTMLGYLVHNETRAARHEIMLVNHEKRIEQVEAVVEYPLYKRSTN